MKNEDMVERGEGVRSLPPANGPAVMTDEVLTCLAGFLCRRRFDLKAALGTIERGIIIETLRSFDGIQSQAAVKLGLKATTLNEKIKKYGINIRKVVAARIILAVDSAARKTGDERDEIPAGRD